MWVFFPSGDDLPAESRVGKGSTGSSRLHTADPSAAKQSESFAATMPGDRENSMSKEPFWLFHSTVVAAVTCRHACFAAGLYSDFVVFAALT